MTCGAPLYGTWRRLVPVRILKSSAPARADELLAPKVSSPGFCLASATSSATDVAGRVGRTTSTSGMRIKHETGVKSAPGS